MKSGSVSQSIRAWLGLLAICTCAGRAWGQGAVSYAITNTGPDEVEAESTVTLRVGGTFDIPLVAGEFTLTATGAALATISNRSANPLAPSGLSYISATSQAPVFDSDLPYLLSVQGPFREVLLDLDPAHDGVPPGTDVLLETIEITPTSVGTLTITLSQPNAATTAGAPDGVMFTSATVDPARASVTLEVYPKLDCSTHPPPDDHHPDSDGDDVPDVCDRCPDFDDRLDADGDEVPDDCDNCPQAANPNQSDIDADGVGDACDNCPITANPGQEDADRDGFGDACDPWLNLSLFDFDRDGDVDQTDFAMIQRCYTGSTVTVAQLFPDGSCDGYDADGDGYVRASNGSDVGDLGWFERCASGSGIPADSACGDCDEHGILDARLNPPDPWVNNFDYDGDGIQVVGRPNCVGGNTSDCDDNCPCQPNADQADSDSDGIGDACEPPPPPPPGSPPPDSDGDGVPDTDDNCPLIANTDQSDWDQDGDGNPCDNCPGDPNADQADTDSDGAGDVCDNCPTAANTPDQEDSDCDGIGDACETDDDNDGVPDTADNCPTIANPDQLDEDGDGIGDEEFCDGCPGIYDPTNADADGDYRGDPCDNCPDVFNYMQTDTDQDGVGDDCDNCPEVANADQLDTDEDGIGDACDEGGEGMMGGESMMGMEFLEPGEPGTTGMAFVQHGTGASSITLPAGGGTVVVDLLIPAGVLGFQAKPAVSAANVVSIDTAGWTDQDNVLYSLDQPGVNLPSAYNYSILEWYVAFPDLPTWQQWAGQIPAPPGVCLESGRSLLQITGPVSGDVLGLSDPLSALAGAVNVPAGDVFTTTGALSGLLKIPLPAGQLSVVTLTLQVSGTPGTYTLGVTEATAFTAEGEELELGMSAPLVITVQGQ